MNVAEKLCARCGQLEQDMIHHAVFNSHKFQGEALLTKVWIVVDISERTIEGVFSTEETAKEYCKGFRYLYVVDFVVDEHCGVDGFR
jgi:hypothetical protein